MTVQIQVNLTDLQYRQLAAVAEKRQMRVHQLIETLVHRTLNPAPSRAGRRGGSAPKPTTPGELAQIRDGNALGRSDAVIARELGWSETRVRRVRTDVLGLPGVRDRLEGKA